MRRWLLQDKAAVIHACSADEHLSLYKQLFAISNVIIVYMTFVKKKHHQVGTEMVSGVYNLQCKLYTPLTTFSLDSHREVGGSVVSGVYHLLCQAVLPVHGPGHQSEPGEIRGL